MIIVEKIEEKYAYIEVEDCYIHLPLSVLPNDVSEGDVLKIVVDKKETESRKKEISNKLENLFNKNR